VSLKGNGALKFHPSYKGGEQSAGSEMKAEASLKRRSVQRGAKRQQSAIQKNGVP